MSIILGTSLYVSRLKEFFRTNWPAVFFSGDSYFTEPAPVVSGIHQFTKDMAIDFLKNKGYKQKDAQLIANAIEDWGLDFEQVQYMSFEVHGESVWMNPE